MINIKNFDSSLLKINKKSYKNIDIYQIGYITIKNISGYESMHSINPFYLTASELDGYIEKRYGSKYLIFAFTDKKRKYWQNT